MTLADQIKAHAKNRKTVMKAIVQTNRSLNTAIKENDENLQYSNVRMLMILCAAYVEASLQFLLCQYSTQITHDAKRSILDQNSHLDRWERLLNYLFRKRYFRGQQKTLNMVHLGHTAFHRYETLKRILYEDIKTVIEVRNKLAHGQWAIAFNNHGSSKNRVVTQNIWQLNKKSVMRAKKAIKCFVTIMEAIAASKNSFEKAFDTEIQRLEQSNNDRELRFNDIMQEIKSKKRKVSDA